MLKPPHWDAYRTVAGAPAGWVDNIDLANAALDPNGTPPFPIVQAHTNETVLLYWRATGIVDRTVETVTFEPLLRDVSNDRWVTSPTVALHDREIGEFVVHDCSMVGFRIHAQAVAPGASAIQVFVTRGLPARRR